MFLDLDLHGWGEPAFMLTVGAIIKSGLAVAGSTVSPRPAEFSAGGQEICHIVARLDLSSEQNCCFRAGGKPNGFTACVYTKDNGLFIPRTAIEQLDGKRGTLNNFCFLGFE